MFAENFQVEATKPTSVEERKDQNQEEENKEAMQANI